jgi:Na+/H+-dicarboxylate symporter
MIVTRLYGKLSPFQRVVIALIFGVVTGIVVGEPAGNLEIIGNVYIRLLQMTVLPYVLVSIIGGLGRLDSKMAASIGFKAIKVIIFVWISVMLSLLLIPLAYPDWEMAGFFSTSMVTESAAFNFLDLYVPANIFSSLAGTVVPAVVLFSLLMGISVISVKNKETLLTLATNLSDGLMGVASFVAKIAPLGIFAISASAAGTIQPEELGRLQVFLWVYLLAATLFTFVLLPLLIHWATPFSYREILSVAGEAIITAMATGTVLVVLPMIVERCKTLLEKHGMACEETESTVDVLVPTAYSFPSTGTLLGLGFILFSAWYIGSPLSIDQYPSYVVMGALTAFGSMAVAIPFMLDFFGLPADQFQLYLLGSVITARFATGLAALHGFVVTLLVASAVMKRLKWSRMLQVTAAHLGITGGMMILAGILLTTLIPYEYTGVKTFESLRAMGQKVKVHKLKDAQPLSEESQHLSRLDVIRKRGTLRVGYMANSLPFVFRNDNNELVGFDMEILSELAYDLNFTLESVYIKDPKEGHLMLDDGRADIIIGGLAITPNRAFDVAFSDPYTHHTAGLVVADARREEFSSIENIVKMDHFNVVVLDLNYYGKMVQERFPKAKLTVIPNPRSYFKGNLKDIDAFFYSAEAGSAWTMLYPQYSIVVPKGLSTKAPVAFALPKGQTDYRQFINTWLKLKKENGYLDRVYDYWILGENPKIKKPRWSVIHNVLGWSWQ